MQPSQSGRAVSLALALLAAFAVQTPAFAQAQMATPGQFDVTPSGAAQYTVPIAVPPGTAGMVPSLALAYNSQGGNGLLGMGWSLSGLSAVTRCPKTLVQDGAKSGINYDANDKYCLDGQRLVAVSGAYGANGTEYRTEREGFSKIVSYGSNGYGPAWFKVWTKSGQVMEFGNTADSAIELQGKAAIRVWALNKVSDTKGNYLTVVYTEDNPNGQYYPNRIDYTGNTAAGLVPYNSVRFVYAARPDVAPLYDGGSVMKTTVRLMNVQTYAKVGGVDTMVKDYRLGYDTSTVTQRSRFISLTECDGAGFACLPVTGFAWNSPGTNLVQPNYGVYALPAALTGNWSTRQGVGGILNSATWGDFNGDGKADYMWIPANGDGRWLIAYGTETGFTTPDYEHPALQATLTGGYITHNYNRNYAAWGDFNGDGKTDYMWADSAVDSRWLVAYSTGTGFTVPGTGATPALPYTLPGGYITRNINPNYATWADFNGDGMTDYMWADSTVDSNWRIAFSTGSGFVVPDNGASYALPYQLPGGYITRNSGLNYATWGDFNGDGKTDYMWADSTIDSNWRIAFSTGSGFVVPDNGASYVLPYQLPGGYITRNSGLNYATWGDFNGDGKTDYMWADSTVDSRWLVAYSTGAGFTVSGTGAIPPVLPYTLPGGYTTRNNRLNYAAWRDFNGDGKLDYIWVPPTTGDGRWLIAYADSQGMQADTLASATTGLNATTAITYKPLTDSTVYTKDSDAVYPYVDVQAPMYVVSSVSSSNGVGGNYVSNYAYAGAKSHMTGGGFLGFRQTTSTDAQTGIVSKTTYAQDYPHQGLPLTAEKRQANNSLLNQVSNTWSFVTNAGWGAQYHVPQLTQSMETSYELVGSTPISTVRTINDYDAYGNPTSIAVSTGQMSGSTFVPDGYSKTTTNTYTNDTANWFLGRLIRATVSSTTP